MIPPQESYSKSFRRLQSKNLQAKGRYLLTLDKYLAKHKVYSRLADLQKQDTIQWRLANKLDNDITRGMLAAEKSCRYLGKDPWSPKLKKARLKVEILKLSLSMAKSQRDYRVRIEKLQGLYGDLMEIPNRTEDINKSLRLAQSELNAVLKTSLDDRKKFLQTKQTAAAIASDPKEALKWRNIQKSEEIKAMYRKLRYIRKDSTQQSGLSRLQVPVDSNIDPKKCTDWKVIDTPHEITQYLLERNRAHFGQAKDTPFATHHHCAKKSIFEPAPPRAN